LCAITTAQTLSDESTSSGSETTTQTRRIRYKSKQKSSHHNRRHKAAQQLTTAAFTALTNGEPEFETIMQLQQQTKELGLYDNSIEEETYPPAATIKRTPNSYAINVTAILGQSAFLPCAVRNLGTHNLLWLRVKDGDVLSYDDMLITQDQRFKLIKKAANESNLLLQGVKLSDAGEYLCQINTDNVKSKSVNLIIMSMFFIFRNFNGYRSAKSYFFDIN
jgi:hypothetical protein